jgi:hypothetical protein
MELPQWNCHNGIATMELPQWNCHNGIATMELPQWNCGVRGVLHQLQLVEPSTRCVLCSFIIDGGRPSGKGIQVHLSNDFCDVPEVTLVHEATEEKAEKSVM